MKKIISTILFVLSSFLSFGQFNNSWIDYSKTYYKFKITATKLYRINQSSLSNIGLGSTGAQNFQLWRNGKEVRLYTSVASGALGASDYIEFWGEMNDGKPDKNLYLKTDYQLDDTYSLFSDTATYFLTVNTASSNLRYTQLPNIISGNSLPADSFFMRRLEQHYRNQINKGYAINLGENIYSSSFDLGEGWTSASGSSFSQSFSNLNKFSNGPANNVTFTISAFANTNFVTRNLGAQFFTTHVLTSPMLGMVYQKDTVNNLPLSLLQNSTDLPVSVAIENSSNPSTDAIVLAGYTITYPATFNFNNQANFYFELPASTTGNYLVITNFNNNGVAPVLHDISNGNRYVGDISTTGQIKFVLPASAIATRKFNLVSEDVSNISTIPSLTSKIFLDLTNAANRGDYLIVSNTALYDNGAGVNNVDLYRQYRSSTTGGSFNAKVYDIDELTDQFAFGIYRHPAAVRDFVRYANNQFTTKPKDIFLIGRGVDYSSFNANQNSSGINQLDLVPTFGWPASDILLVSDIQSVIPLTPVGRLGAVNGNEVGIYLTKIKQYEQAQQSTSQTIADKGWMKNFLHTSGGGSSDENNRFLSYLNNYQSIAKDTFMGANVTTIAKSTSAAVEVDQNAQITNLFQQGLGYISYFGHASSNLLAINLNYPETYSNQGKYPFFQISGCLVGDYYTYNPYRLTGYDNMSYTEKYIFLDQKGSIGVLAGTYFGVENYLDPYNVLLCNNFSKTMYGKGVGSQIQNVVQNQGTNLQPGDELTRYNLEELNLHGDPAVVINSFAKPDYDIETQLVKFSSNQISVADGSFKVAVKWVNLGKAVKDSMRVSVKQQMPDNSVRILYNQMIAATYSIDSINLTVPINALKDGGLNTLLISVDDGNRIAELSETNNTLNIPFTIYSNTLNPIYPYNYSIVNTQNINFYASTADPLKPSQQYVMQLDTTQLFNSPFLKSYNNTSVGGVIQFTPTALTFTDSTVYYWRTAAVPTGSASYVWNGFSFIYLANSTEGFNQSHYYQNLNSADSNINYLTNRQWQFGNYTSSVNVVNGVFPTASSTAFDFAIAIDGNNNIASVCGISNIIINVFNPYGMVAMPNVASGNGLFNSDPVCGPSRRWNFQYNILQQSKRVSAVQFLDQVPNGYYVIVRNTSGNDPASNTYATDWQADTAVLGSGNSLYHRLKSAGFATVDSFNRPRAFCFAYKKADNSFTPVSLFSNGINDKIFMNFNCQARNYLGTITSPVFGPAKAWSKFHWRGFSQETTPGDSISFKIIGISSSGVQTNLITLDSTAKDVDISSIDANQYPNLKIQMFNQDSANGTPYQLQYLRLNYTPVPEGAIAPNIAYQMPDTVPQGAPINFKVAFKNISSVPFSSAMAINLIITDSKNQQHAITIPKAKILLVGDTIVVTYQFNSSQYPGNNSINVVFNPNNDQPEVYHFNNLLTKFFYVIPNSQNPVLDVSFDGVHILNNDIVSSRPHILIKLTDGSKYQALSDTSLLKVQITYPDGSLHNYPYGPNMVFTPANLATGVNVATIDFTPTLTDTTGNGSTYLLTVYGQNSSGILAGVTSYKVNFVVYNKAMISNLLNYPNPFTTSTAFVFTVTGSQPPQNMRIQILTISGKIVREITTQELGSIHVGTNITQFKWDGTDSYGQKLANGVYLYRVITNLNGKTLDKFNNGGDNTDQFFNKGYGKMVILR